MSAVVSAMVSTATMVDALLVEVGTVEAVVIATMLDALLGEVGTVEAVVIATMLDALLENVGTVVEVVIATMLDADLEAVDMVVAAAVESHLRWRHQRVESYRVVVEFWASLKPSSQDKQRRQTDTRSKTNSQSPETRAKTNTHGCNFLLDEATSSIPDPNERVRFIQRNANAANAARQAAWARQSVEAASEEQILVGGTQ